MEITQMQLPRGAHAGEHAAVLYRTAHVAGLTERNILNTNNPITMNLTTTTKPFFHSPGINAAVIGAKELEACFANRVFASVGAGSLSR